MVRIPRSQRYADAVRLWMPKSGFRDLNMAFQRAARVSRAVFYGDFVRPRQRLGAWPRRVTFNVNDGWIANSVFLEVIRSRVNGAPVILRLFKPACRPGAAQTRRDGARGEHFLTSRNARVTTGQDRTGPTQLLVGIDHSLWDPLRSPP